MDITSPKYLLNKTHFVDLIGGTWYRHYTDQCIPPPTAVHADGIPHVDVHGPLNPP